MGKIISIANQKGGVGKTTSSVNISACLGSLNKKTLLIDIDPQGNATSGLGFNKKEIEKSTYHILTNQEKASDIILKTQFENLDLIPANMELVGAEIELVDVTDRINILKKAIVSLKENYDYIIIDCPPSLGIITLNALTVCDSVIVPIQCEYYALEGLSQLMSTIKQVKSKYNSTIDIEGVLLTMFDGRLNLTIQVVQEVKNFFPNKVYKTVIPRNVRLSEAPSFGQPIIYFDKSSKGAKAYIDLATEIIKKNK